MNELSIDNSEIYNSWKHWITKDTVINVPSEKRTVQDAIDSLQGKVWANNVNVEIVVWDGEYEFDSLINIDLLCPVTIRGKHVLERNITAFVSVTGTTTNWDVTVTLDDVTGLVVGMYANIFGAVGTGTTDGVNGCWQITGISSNDVTVKNTRVLTTFPSALTAGSFHVPLSQFKSAVGFTGSHFNIASFVNINRLIFIGDNRVSEAINLARFGKFTNCEISSCGFNDMNVGIRVNEGNVVVSECSLSNNDTGIIGHASTFLNVFTSILNGNNVGCTSIVNGLVRLNSSQHNGNTTDVNATLNSKVSQLTYDATAIYSPAWQTLGNNNSYIT